MAVAFVSGATGFLGRHLVEALQADGWQVVALCRPGTDITPLQRPGVEWVAADLGAWKNIRDVMPPRAEAVFHAAYNASLWPGDAEEQTRLNVFGTRNMVRAALEKRAQRFIHSSSIVAYGLHSGTITEDTPSRAARSSINLVRAMAQAEREVRRGMRHGLAAVILNPANMLGAHGLSAWGRILHLVQQRRIVGAPAGGGSFCHVRAVAQAHVQAVTRGRIGHNYLLGGVDLTYVSLLNQFGRALGRPTLSKPLPRGLLDGYARMQELLYPLVRRRPYVTRNLIELLSAHTYCKSRKAMTELDYQPAPLEQMIEDSIAWLRSEQRG
jgi:nucleoside-diphosphate-sugar epimerase